MNRITSRLPTIRDLFALRRFSLAIARVFAPLLVVVADSLDPYSIHFSLGETILAESENGRLHSQRF